MQQGRKEKGSKGTRATGNRCGLVIGNRQQFNAKEIKKLLIINKLSFLFLFFFKLCSLLKTSIII